MNAKDILQEVLFEADNLDCDTIMRLYKEVFPQDIITYTGNGLYSVNQLIHGN